jgi:GT2 family glycosyltransferase
VHFANLHLSADNYAIALFDRSDIGDAGCAFVIFIAADPRRAGDIVTCILNGTPGDGSPFGVELRATALSERCSDPGLVARARNDLLKAASSEAVASLNRLFSQQGYSGESTIDRLCCIHLAVDESIPCPNGILLIGWMFDPRHEIARMVLHHGDDSTAVLIECFVRTERPDVAKAFEDTYGAVDPYSGFITFVPVPDFANHGGSLYLEVISRRGAIGYQTLPEGKLCGITAIKRVLGAFAALYSDVSRTLGLLGPAIAQLNSERLAVPVGVAQVQFGEPPGAPVCSVIVPVHGRCEFVEDQMALFSRTALSGAYEFIYILDDPPRRMEFLSLCESVFNRFHVPLTVLLLAENTGFAPANNIGLGRSRGEFICFLNSDVFPADDNWLDSLIRQLRREPTIGTIGPLLVFEDNTVQHCGMAFEKLVEFGNLAFPLHPAKGCMPKERRQIAEVTAITGACMVMRRTLAEKMGGFDESFIIGDFEDSDLCLRIRQSGQICAVDPGVRLYHLERQSQMASSAPWRMNLTLYNAWTHAARWSSVLDGEVAETGHHRRGRQSVARAVAQ